MFQQITQNQVPTNTSKRLKILYFVFSFLIYAFGVFGIFMLVKNFDIYLGQFTYLYMYAIYAIIWCILSNLLGTRVYGMTTSTVFKINVVVVLLWGIPVVMITLIFAGLMIATQHMKPFN